MKFIEKLALHPSPEYRVGLEEGNLAALASALFLYLEKTQDPEEIVIFTALELCPILEKVRGEDQRWFRKMASKLKKLCKKFSA